MQWNEPSQGLLDGGVDVMLLLLAGYMAIPVISNCSA